jgi:hypothetical protein
MANEVAANGSASSTCSQTACLFRSLGEAAAAVVTTLRTAKPAYTALHTNVDTLHVHAGIAV